MSSPSPPLPMEGGCPKGRGLVEDEKSEANLRRYAPSPSRGRRGEVVKNHLPPSHGRGMPEGRGLAEGERERSQPPALRATSFQRKEGEVAKTYLLSFYRKECFATGMPMITNRPRVSKSMRIRSRELRNQMTPEEKQLWYHFLRTYRPRVTRQYVLGPYIADFYCAKAGLIIEIDGKQHCTESGFAHDTVRTHFFENYGLKVVRLTNFQIHFQFNECCQYLETILRERIMERATMGE